MTAGISGTDVDDTGKTPVETAFEQNQEGCMLKLIQAKVKMPWVRAQVTSVGDEFEVVLN